MTRPSPKTVELVTPRELRIVWRDGAEHRYAARTLRLACPCAGCVDEGSGVRTLRPESVAADVSVLHIQPVGRYAVAPTFSDTHGTGIFPWDYLRHLGEGGVPKGNRPAGDAADRGGSQGTTSGPGQ